MSCVSNSIDHTLTFLNWLFLSASFVTQQEDRPLHADRDSNPVLTGRNFQVVAEAEVSPWERSPSPVLALEGKKRSICLRSAVVRGFPLAIVFLVTFQTSGLGFDFQVFIPNTKTRILLS